jgi:hypothetical protein
MVPDIANVGSTQIVVNKKNMRERLEFPFPHATLQRKNHIWSRYENSSEFGILQDFIIVYLKAKTLNCFLSQLQYHPAVLDVYLEISQHSSSICFVLYDNKICLK